MEASTTRTKSAADAALVQQRIALFGRTLFVVFLAVPVLGISLLEMAVPGVVRRLPAVPYALIATLTLGALWLFCRRGTHSVRTLTVVDAASMIAAGSAIATVTFQTPAEVPIGVPTTLLLTYLLASRAIVVPSNWRKTAWISVLAALPSIATMWGLGVGYEGSLHPTLLVLPVWCVLAVLLATWTSHVVYELRRSVYEARKLGQYTLETQIGEGGMGVVFRARHAMLRRPTVIKLLPLEKAGQANVVRFEREVQLTSQLSSPNTVAIFDFGRTDEGIFYYAMEYLDGVDLEQLVAESGALPASRVIWILVQICTSLSEAHEAGLVHRDVKPGNVMLCRHGGAFDVVKVLDFGLVKDMSPGSDATLTHTEAVLGTPLYISPEAIVQPEAVGAQSDLYAVGALGYHLLTGRRVFDGRTVAEVYAHHLYSPPLAPSQYDPRVPTDLEALLLACLQKSPQDRPSSARALRASLLGCADAGRWSEADARAFWDARGRNESPEANAAQAATVGVTHVTRA